MDDARTAATPVDDLVEAVTADAVVLLLDRDGKVSTAAASVELPVALGGAVHGDFAAHVHPADRPRLDAAREAGWQGHQATCTIRIGDGQAAPHWFEVRHLPDLVEGKLVVLLRDVSRVRRTAADAALLRRITELSNAGSDLDQAAGQAVEELRVTLEWEAGHVLAVEDGALVDAAGWSVDAAAGEQDLVSRLRGIEGPGVSAAAAQRGRPVTSDDVPDPDRLDALRTAGVAGVVGVPIIADDEVVRVIEMFTAHEPALDDDRRALLHEIGRQLGSVAVRHEARRGLEASHLELERSNAELERFAYVASHDLQEPLRKIIGFTEILKELRPPANDEEEEFFGYVIDASYRLQRLIKELLAYSRAGRRELTVDRVDLEGLMAGILDDLELAIGEGEVDVTVGPLPAVSGDPAHLREALQNLVANAVKYRSEERASFIRVTGAREGDTVHVAVADNGIGIPEAHRTAVFEVFRRLHPAHVYSGTGLGLALVERIVHRHGGQVSISDGPDGVGTTIHLELPAAEGT